MQHATGSGHGRVNLIGEHTDYNGGLALPMTLPLRVSVAADLRTDWRIAVQSGAYPEDGVVQFGVGEWGREGRWTDFVRAASALLAREGIFEHGASLTIASDIPPGAGLASSAALSVALVQALSALGDVALEPADIARLARAIETDYIDVPVGEMDQWAALGQPHRAQLIDFAGLTRAPVVVPAAIAIEIVDSGVAHENRSGNYAVRRAECEAAAAALGVRTLRALEDLPDAADRLAQLPDPLRQRARHVVTENQRVRDAIEALARGDLAAFGALLVASHASLRDDFQVSLPEIDAIVERALATPGVLGARLTGSGFGGSVVIVKQA